MRFLALCLTAPFVLASPALAQPCQPHWESFGLPGVTSDGYAAPMLVYNPGQGDSDQDGIGDACGGAGLELQLAARGDSKGVVTPGGFVGFDIVFRNRTRSGARADVSVTLRDPSGHVARRRKPFVIEGFAGVVSTSSSSMSVPHDGKRGTWLIVAEARVRDTQITLSAALAVTVK